jgi:hypothetical protein
MAPEGSVDDDSDQDGGMPEDSDDDDPCVKPSPDLRTRTESIDG